MNSSSPAKWLLSGLVAASIGLALVALFIAWQREHHNGRRLAALAEQLAGEFRRA